MFWRHHAAATSANDSNIDILLDRENVTLEEVLSEEEMLQELKTHNQKLIAFLCRPEVTEKLLSYIVTEPSPAIEERSRFKFSYLASEVLNCDIIVLIEAITANKEVLGKVWRYLDTENELNPILASYFTRLNTILLTRNPTEMVAFIKSRPLVLDKLLKHMETSSIMELLIKIISLDVVTDGESTTAWMKREQFMAKLISKMEPGADVEVISNTTIGFTEMIIASHAVPPMNELLSDLSEESVLSLLDQFLCKDKLEFASVVSERIAVVVELVRRCVGPGIFNSLEMIAALPDYTCYQPPLETLPESYIPSNVNNPALFDLIFRAVSARLPAILDALKSPRTLSEEAARHSYGSERLRLTQLLVELLHSRTEAVNKRLDELKGLPILIDHFFQFPWNNFLHTLVQDMVLTLLSNSLEKPENKSLVFTLFKDCRITEKIVAAQEKNDDKSLPNKRGRLGYMGCLTYIAEAVLRFHHLHPEGMPELDEFFDNPKWKDYVNSALQQTRDRNEKQIAGGRPFAETTDGEDNDINELVKASEINMDQFSKFLSQQMQIDVPDNFGFEDSDYDEDEGTEHLSEPTLVAPAPVNRVTETLEMEDLSKTDSPKSTLITDLPSETTEARSLPVLFQHPGPIRFQPPEASTFYRKKSSETKSGSISSNSSSNADPFDSITITAPAPSTASVVMSAFPDPFENMSFEPSSGSVAGPTKPFDDDFGDLVMAPETHASVPESHPESNSTFQPSFPAASQDIVNADPSQFSHPPQSSSTVEGSAKIIPHLEPSSIPHSSTEPKGTLLRDTTLPATSAEKKLN